MADIENSSLISPGWLATLVLAAAAGLGVIWLQAGILGRDSWPVEWLEVEGEIRRTSAEQIQAAVVVHASHGFFAVDLENLRRAVVELPWIESAEIRRRWPDTLVIQVGEHRPVARWNETRLVNHRGEQFAVPGANELQGLPWLQGPDSRLAEVLDMWVLMHRELAAINAGVERVILNDRGAWEARLSNGVVLRLGREDPAGRVRRYVKVADELRGLHEFAPDIVDLRHTNGLAVRWPKSGLGTRDSGLETGSILPGPSEGFATGRANPAELSGFAGLATAGPESRVPSPDIEALESGFGRATAAYSDKEPNG